MSLPQNQDQIKTNPDGGQPIAFAARCAVITGVGRSAVAVVAIEGPEAMAIVVRCFRAAGHRGLAPGQVRYGRWVGPESDEMAEESVVVTPLVGGGAEIHCHGGPAATARIVADLRSFGAVVTDPHRWSGEANPPLIREAAEVLARCLTARTAAIAMDQLRGAMQDWAMNALVRHADGDDAMMVIREQAEAMLRFAPLGLHLTRPFRVVLLGPPNVGKSSLLNAIVGYDRSITYDAAGTTRDVLHAETVIDGWPVRLSDTAGIRATVEPVEREGVLRARSEAEGADLLLVVTEPAQVGPIEFLDVDEFQDDLQPPRRSASGPIPARMIRILNKADLWNSVFGPDATTGPACGHETRDLLASFDLMTGALTGEGLPRLMAMISTRLADAVPEPGTPVPITERQVDALRGIVQAPSCRRLRDALHSLLGSESPVEESCVE